MQRNGVQLLQRIDLDRASVLEALYGLATALADTSTPHAAAALVAHTARTLLSADDVAVYLWDRDAHLLRLAHVEGGQHALHARPTVAPGDGAVGQALATGRAVVVPDYVPWPHALPELVNDGVTCAIAIPIRVAARTIGAVAARFVDRRRCAAEHVRALELLTAQVAAVLDAALYLSTLDTVSERLSPRESEVLTLLTRGATNRQIAQELHLSPGTVKKHVEHILKKLGSTDRTQAAVRASALGLVERTA